MAFFSGSVYKLLKISSRFILFATLHACTSSSSSPLNSLNPEADLSSTLALEQTNEDGNPLLSNPSFEIGTTDWEYLSIEDSEYFAPVHGERYASVPQGSNPVRQITDHSIEAGKTYTVTAWARSIYTQTHIKSLQANSLRFPWGNAALATAQVELLAGSSPIVTIQTDVSPVQLSGVPRFYPNDDGGNVWIDGGYRHAFADYHFIQPLGADPIEDPWRLSPDSQAYRRSSEDQLAVSPVIIGDRKALYLSSTSGERLPVYSQIGFVEVFDRRGYSYDWLTSGPAEDQEVILNNVGDGDPLIFDPHLFYDQDSQRLWMTWGGGSIFVSELDPDTGRLLSEPTDLEFNTHEPGVHTEVARWDGDIWTGDNTWIEGPALWKHEGFWYLFSSYGNLGENYTIRMGRSQSPTGPFVDKDGVTLVDYNPALDRFGSSFLLGDEGNHLVPGHPHIWQEEDRVYLGYDYRNRKGAEGLRGTQDTFGIRELHWVDGWPTVWEPISVTFHADDHPGAIGQPLGIALSNVGERSSRIGFDQVQIQIE